jgi:hypothetical protein
MSLGLIPYSRMLRAFAPAASSIYSRTTTPTPVGGCGSETGACALDHGVAF